MNDLNKNHFTDGMESERGANALWESLHSPGTEYRSVPFWGWNARLKPEYLRFQMDEMREQGMGGFFIHSREGLETPYLSEEWMEDVKLCTEKAKQDGMEVWLYDEDKWPSGSAGGLVSAQDPARYAAKALTMELLPAVTEYLRQNCTSGDDACAGDRKSSGCSRFSLPQEYDAKNWGHPGEIVILRQETSGNSMWYNGFAPSDMLNAEAVREFLRLTHENYQEHVGTEFGKTIRGFFTDEPNCCDFFSTFTEGRPWLPWTDDFAKEFEKRRGYDPMELLPGLFLPGENSTQIRHDYWRTLTELFSECYMRQVYDWCEARGMRLAGHLLYENDLGYQTRVCGAAMPHYQYLHVPGIDILGEQTKEYLAVKQCTSVAHQYGRRDVVAEVYGCTGWEFDFEGQKWLGDWLYVMGVTRRCEHMAQYSITGCRKRDYPPVFQYQTTWWKDFHLMEDYFARLSMCVQTGEVVRDILVLHPITSVWTQCGSDPKEDLGRVHMNMGWLDKHILDLNIWGEQYNRLARLLLGAHLDFDFGDETLLAQIGAAEDGKLKVGKCSYSTVIVPGVLSLFESTVKLLEQFVKTGGHLIWVGEFPDLLEGRRSSLIQDTFSLCPVHRAKFFEELPQILRECQEPSVCVQAKEGGEDTSILTMLRRTEDGYLLLAINNDRHREHPVRFSLRMTGRTEAYDPWTDSRREVSVRRTNTGMCFIEELAPAGSMVYYICTKERPSEGKADFPYRHPHDEEAVLAALGPEASFSRTMPNVLTLDCCRYALSTDSLSEEMEVWQAQKEIRERLSMQQVYFNGAPQRYFWTDKPCENDGIPFALEFTFDVEEIPELPCHVVIEKPDGLRISCNGVFCTEREGFFMDRDMQKIRLEGLRTGTNHLRLTGCYLQKMELEDIYIIGDFGVSTERVITRERKVLHFGDWCLQGYYHYPGSIVYHFSVPKPEFAGKRIVLRMGDYRGTLAKVCINGKPAGALIGKAYDRLEIGKYLTAQENTLDIEIVGSPRNMMGPFHQSYTGCSRISWADFRTEGRFHCDGYVLEPYGLMGQITVLEEEENDC